MGLLAAFSAKGGCGASLVATNLGLALARSAPTLLFDLHNPEGGDDLLLDLSCPHAWPELLPVGSELTERQIGLVTCRHAEGLVLLAAPTSPLSGSIPDGRLRVLLEALVMRFAWVIVDAPSGEWPWMLAEISDTIPLVSTGDPPALRSARRLLQSKPSSACGRIGLVLNQVSRGQPASANEIAASLACPLLASIPVDPRGVGYQVNFGRACWTGRVHSAAP